MVDLRQQKRFGTSFLVTWDRGATWNGGEGIVENIGIGGCKITTQTPLTREAEPILTLFLPKHGLLHLPGLVRWQVGCDMGVEFIRLEPVQLERLHAFMVSLEHNAVAKADTRSRGPELK